MCWSRRSTSFSHARRGRDGVPVSCHARRVCSSPSTKNPARISFLRYLLFGDCPARQVCRGQVPGRYGFDVNAAYGTNFTSALQDIRPPAATGRASTLTRLERISHRLCPPRYKSAGFGGAAAAYSPSPLLDRYHRVPDETRFHGSTRDAGHKPTIRKTTIFSRSFLPLSSPTSHNWTSSTRCQKRRTGQAFEATLPAHYFHR